MPYATKSLLDMLREERETQPVDPELLRMLTEGDSSAEHRDPYLKVDLKRQSRARMAKEMLRRAGNEELARMVRIKQGRYEEDDR